ncbi:nuclease-related domain-containing protein [Curtobacterium sp. RHCKG23]|uniref:Nuclease-related domain-containing protein n=1 Tax=Curtobacterium citri TaxID=3055139 RepID=A0ABT7T9C1_9MICO|nr:nuclease-related domain-containing protein [Curtobacterium citri]MDM7886179.1 nuclease-related domain-containing protein [Curtobacterium citri]
MTSDLVPWLVAGGLAVVVVVLVIVLRRNQSSSRTALADAEARSDHRIGTLEREQRERAAAAEAEHARRLADAGAAQQQARTEAEHARDLARTGMRWEEASQRTILAACKAADVNGALCTNVVFVPVAQGERAHDRSFAAQVDHVLVLESGHVLVIENKRWNGIVFDGRKPSSVHHAFRNLLDESSLTGSFAIQVRSRRVLDTADEVEHWWQVRVQAGGTAPTRQVRQQARRLQRFLTDADGNGPQWIDSCVFYSGDAAAYVNPEDRSSSTTPTGRSATTAVVTDENELRVLVTDLARKHAVPNRARTDAVVRKLAGQGAHTITIGTYRLPEA